MKLLTPFRTRFAIGLLLAIVAWFWPAGWRFAVPAFSPFVAVSSAIALRSLAITFLCGVPVLVWVSIRRRFWCRRMCPVGLLSESCGKWRGPARHHAAPPRTVPPARLLALATIGGALVGYPIFLWMDPLALFGGFFSAGRIVQPGFTPWAVAGFPLLMLVSFGWPGKWCARLCPLGGAQDLLAMATQSWRKQRVGPLRGRRGLLAAGAGVMLAAVLPRSWAGRSRPLRPPGAVDEAAFQGGCIRCGSCSRACPTGIIEPAIDHGRLAGILAPELRFREARYCRQDCNLCGRVCPSGVIRPLALAEKNRHVIGVAVVEKAGCYLAIERECGVCVPRCPRGALVDIFVPETYQSVIQVMRERCNGCGACVGICPPQVIHIEAV